MPFKMFSMLLVAFSTFIMVTAIGTCKRKEREEVSNCPSSATSKCETFLKPTFNAKQCCAVFKRSGKVFSAYCTGAKLKKSTQNEEDSIGSRNDQLCDSERQTKCKLFCISHNMRVNYCLFRDNTQGRTAGCDCRPDDREHGGAEPFIRDRLARALCAQQKAYEKSGELQPALKRRPRDESDYCAWFKKIGSSFVRQSCGEVESGYHESKVFSKKGHVNCCIKKLA